MNSPQAMVPACGDTMSSEDDLPCELNRAWGIEGAGACHGAEVACGHRIVRIESLLNFRIRITSAGMVEEIPSLRAKLEFQILPDIEALEEREVDVAISGTVDGVASRGAIGAQSRNREGCRVDTRCPAVIVATVFDVVVKTAMRAWLVDPVRTLNTASRQANIRLVES
jgi:hypothetical protein